MRFLAAECCPKAIVDRLRAIGRDVHYAVEPKQRSVDAQLLAVADREDRIILTEDFDFGDLLIRDRKRAPGAMVLFLSDLAPAARAARLEAVLALGDFEPGGMLTIVEVRRVRQRPLDPQ